MPEPSTRSEADRQTALWWARSQRQLMTAAVLLMAVLGVLWLGYQFWRLLWQPATLAGRAVAPGGIDLLKRHEEIRLWFSGAPIDYWIYPPASYVLLWPLIGWLEPGAVVALWAITSAVALVGLVVIAVRETRFQDQLQRLFVALLPLSMYAPGATIGNGQLDLHVLFAVVVGILMLRRAPVSWRRDVAGASLVLASLVKPNVSAPFFWLVAFSLGRWRPAVLVAFGYLAATLTASAFQSGDFVQHLHGWMVSGSNTVLRSSAPDGSDWPTQLSRNSLQYILTLLGLQDWTQIVSLIVLAALGVWVYRHRRADIWTLLSVSAIVARLWTYHRWYDDLLLLLPLITLLRMIRAEGANVMTGGLVVCVILAGLAPGGLFLLPLPWNGVYVVAQIAVWLAMLGCIIQRGTCRHEATRTSP